MPTRTELVPALFDGLDPIVRKIRQKVESCQWCGTSTFPTHILMINGNGTRIPSITLLASAAVAALRALRLEEIRPLHYVDLARLAFGVLDWTPCCAESARQGAEHVRQPLADCRSHGAGWIAEGRSRGLVYLDEWFESPRLFASNPIENPFSFEETVVACVEAMDRLPYLHNTYNHAPARIHPRFAAGLIVQGHAAGFAHRVWPSIYLPPTNAGDPTRPAADDFRMRVNGRVELYDVKTPNRSDGRYQAIRRPDGRVSAGADFYLLADAEGASWRWLGWCTRREFIDGVSIESARSTTSLVVRWNCAVYGLHYEDVVGAWRARGAA